MNDLPNNEKIISQFIRVLVHLKMVDRIEENPIIGKGIIYIKTISIKITK